jgi:hypothetical protein
MHIFKISVLKRFKAFLFLLGINTSKKDLFALEGLKIALNLISKHKKAYQI